MTKPTITFRIGGDMKAALDEPAEGVDRRQVDHVREGLRQAEAGEFATQAEVAAAFARWRS